MKTTTTQRAFLGCLLAAIGPPVLLIAILGLHSWYVHSIPLPPRPMFHILNTEEIRSFDGPNWHEGLRLSDEMGRTVFIDHNLNLLLIIVIHAKAFQTNAVDCRPDSATFFPDTDHEFTVAARTNSVLVYDRDALVAEATLPEDGSRSFVDEWFKQGPPRDVQLAIDALGYGVSIPRLEPEPTMNTKKSGK